MSEIEEYIEEIKNKISKIPNFPRTAVFALLKVLPVANERRRKKIVQKIDKLVESAFNRHVLNSTLPVLDFPTREEAGGTIKVGYVCAGDQVLHPFLLTTENLRENVFATARAGHGKTTLVFNFVDQLIIKGIKFFIPDWKNDYAVLARKYQNILVVRYFDWEYNPLTNVPEGMDIKDWHRVVFTIFCHSFGLLSATESYLLQCVEELREDKEAVTFRDLESYLKTQAEQSRKKSEYHDVAENRVFTLNHSLDKVINVKYGFEVKELFDGRTVMVMAPLEFPIASFLFQCLVMHEFYRRLKNNVRMNRKSALDAHFVQDFLEIIMDEAHLTQYGPQQTSWVSQEHSPHPLTTFFSQSREFLIGTFALTQFPHLVMESFKDNAATKLIGSITESTHQRDLAASIGLDRDDEKIFAKLQKGYWVMSVAGRTKPFLLKTPDLDRGALVAEAEMLARSKPLLDRLRMRRQEIESRIFLNEVQRQDPNKVHLPELPEDAWKVLDYVFHQEFSYQKQIADGIGLSPHKLDDMKKLLLSKNLIRIEAFPVYTHVRAHYVLTPKTLDIFKTLGKNPQRISYWRFLSTNPGYFHRYFQFLFLGMHRKLGWKGSVERDLPNGRRVDIFVQREEDGKRKVVEIETSTTDLGNKVRVIQDGYCDELVLLYKDMVGVQLARSKLEKIEGIDVETIWIGLIRDYVELLSGILKARESAGNRPNHEAAGSKTYGNGKPSGNEGENS